MKPEDVIENCLKDIAAGHTSAADCQARFPDMPDLEAQVRVVQRLRSAPTLTLRPEVLRRQEESLRRYVRVHYQSTSRRGWVWRSALAACTLLLLVFGLVNVSGRSLPGEPLYGLKRTVETVQLTFTPLRERTITYLRQAEQRLTEIEQLTQQGEINPTLLTSLLTDLATSTEAAIASVNDFSSEPQTAMWNSILAETERQEATLAALEPVLPAAVRPVWEFTRQTAREGHALAILYVTQASPPVTATASSTPFTHLATTTTTLTWTPTNRPLGSPTHVSPTITQRPPQPTLELLAATDAPSLPTPTHMSAETPALTATIEPTHAPGGEGGQSDCRGGNPNSPNYCTPTPLPPEPTSMPTACPTNPGGQPKCH